VVTAYSLLADRPLQFKQHCSNLLHNNAQCFVCDLTEATFLLFQELSLNRYAKRVPGAGGEDRKFLTRCSTGS
jgi:hypothetical protein